MRFVPMRKVESINRHTFNGLQVNPERNEQGRLRLWAYLLGTDGEMVKVDILPTVTPEEYEELHNIF